jgi:hypothetical protein
MRSGPSGDGGLYIRISVPPTTANKVFFPPGLHANVQFHSQKRKNSAKFDQRLVGLPLYGLLTPLAV